MITIKDEFLIPYSGKVWWVESLVNLVNRQQFAKLKPSKVVVTINNLLADRSFAKLFPTKCLKRVNSPNIYPTIGDFKGGLGGKGPPAC